MENKVMSSIGLILEKVDKEALEEEAYKRGLGVSALVRMLIKDFLSKRGGDRDKIIL